MLLDFLMNSTSTATFALDLDHLLRLRLVVGRTGEADLHGWWNSQGVLGEIGASLYRRGFPRTHPWTRAKVVFEVARQRCLERYPSPRAVTLWNLPAQVEDAFEHRWSQWLDATAAWAPFFLELQALPRQSLVESLKSFSLWDSTLDRILPNMPGPGASALQITASTLDNRTATLLAAGFALGKPGEPIIPWVDLGAGA